MSESNNTPLYGSRFMRESLPKTKMSQDPMDPKAAYTLINMELQTQGKPSMNMASFVTTTMDPECDQLIHENLGVNYIDTEVYRANLEIQIDASICFWIYIMLRMLRKVGVSSVSALRKP